MNLTRLAVSPGTAVIRVAGAEPGHEPRILAALAVDPALGPPPSPAAALAEVTRERPEELVLVHPASWPPARVAAFTRGPADRVRAVPSPVAAFAGPGLRVVLDVGHSGAEATLLRDGAVVRNLRCGIGGAALDDIVSEWLTRRGAPPVTGPARTARRAEARRVREQLSLRAAAEARVPGGTIRIDADELRAVLTPPMRRVVALLAEVLAGVPGRVAPVLLIGGVARTPLLAELIDAELIDAGLPGTGLPDPGAGAEPGGGLVVAPGPDDAAVLGALAGRRWTDTPRVQTHRTDFPPLLPPVPPPRRRPVRMAAISVAAAGAAVGLLAVGERLTPLTAGAAASEVGPAVLVQYGYRLDLPAGWEHSGGLPERRRSLLTPVATPQGSDLIAVERTPLGYDALAEPDRARAELRAEFDSAVAGGADLSGYDPAARLAGRDGIAYRQRDDRGEVDWFVVLDGDAQLSVGCRHTESGAEQVRSACAVVVASIRRA